MTESTKIPLSVAIIAKDEADNLPKCLKSLFFAEQIVVVDSGSMDNTMEIAAAAGCDVFAEPWRGFGPQKQLALDKCRNEWILVLDADERIPDETASVIRNIVQQNDMSISGYSFPRKNFFQGRWIRHMGWWPDRVVRLFRKRNGRMSLSRVHESVIVEGRVESLHVPIEHYTESRLSPILKKIDKYSTLGAIESSEAGKSSSITSAVMRASLAFIQNYFLRRGFLDGRQGLTLAVLDSVNKFFKYAKLNELGAMKSDGEGVKK